MSKEVYWNCPKCGFENTDDKSLTSVPLCGGCDTEIHWDEIAPQKQNRDPRVKKLRDSKRIRVKHRYHRGYNRGKISLPLVNKLPEDKSGFPVYVQSHDYNHTFTVKAVRRFSKEQGMNVNGRNGVRTEPDYDNSGKSSRIGMRRKNQWREEAENALNNE